MGFDADQLRQQIAIYTAADTNIADNAGKRTSWAYLQDLDDLGQEDIDFEVDQLLDDIIIEVTVPDFSAHDSRPVAIVTPAPYTTSSYRHALARPAPITFRHITRYSRMYAETRQQKKTENEQRHQASKTVAEGILESIQQQFDFQNRTTAPEVGNYKTLDEAQPSKPSHLTVSFPPDSSPTCKIYDADGKIYGRDF